jgi:hypothetical protein
MPVRLLISGSNNRQYDVLLFGLLNIAGLELWFEFGLRQRDLDFELHRKFRQQRLGFSGRLWHAEYKQWRLGLEIAHGHES